jgi:hypothetical protein
MNGFSTGGMYDPEAIVEALGGEWNPVNHPKSRAIFESREGLLGGPQVPTLSLTLSTGNQDIVASSDATIFSWMAHVGKASGPLSVRMDDGNRTLLEFSLSSVDPEAILQKAELILDMVDYLSDPPLVAPFDLAVHVVTEQWYEGLVKWLLHPEFEPIRGAVATIDPNYGLKVIDVTGIVSNWLAEAIPNYGILLKVAEPVPEIPDITFPYEEASVEPLPWPHQAPWLTPQEIESLNQQIYVVNDFPLYQATQDESTRYFHSGLDIVLDNGTPIYAMKNGWVKAVLADTIVIADTAGNAPSYGWEYTHLSNFQVQVGDFVATGTFIGEVYFPQGLPHIHLVKAFSEGGLWGSWRYLCIPNGHFSYIDEEPPVINTPFYFFENNSDTEIGPDGTGNVVLSGEVDIVVPMREQGLYARSSSWPGWPTDRLAVTKIEYEIRPAGSGPGSGRLFHSFDFNDIKIKDDYSFAEDAELTRVVYKHWAFVEGERTGSDWDKCFCYYIITNCSGEQSPREINISDQNYCWDTTALDANGQPIFPNGIYDIIVTAYDSAGHSAGETMAVAVKHPGTELLIPDQFPTIQQAIDVAVDGDTISVAPDVYVEEIDFLGKAVTLRGAPAAATIDGAGGSAVSFGSGEGPNSVLTNCVIRNSYTAISLTDTSPTIRSVTVCDNQYGVAASVGAQPDISNSIFWNNAQDDLLLCYASYSCIEDGDSGLGNIADAPLFVDSNNCDYHLSSGSPAIDAGDPNSHYSSEPWPNGGRINMGAYGNTNEATRSSADFDDLARFAGCWLEYDAVIDTAPEPAGDGIINFLDFAILANWWLR